MAKQFYEFDPADEIRLRGLGTASGASIADALIDEDCSRRKGGETTVDRLVERNHKLTNERAANAETIATLRCDLKRSRELALMFAMVCAGLIGILAWRCL